MSIWNWLQDMKARVSMGDPHLQLFVCVKVRKPGKDKACCGGSGAVDTLAVLQAEVERRGLQDRVEVVPTGCLDHCEAGPAIFAHTGKPETDPPRKHVNAVLRGKVTEYVTPETAAAVLDRLLAEAGLQVNVRP